ncbi:hypothetical protein KI387_017738, partial [Taxus chinensis]
MEDLRIVGIKVDGNCMLRALAEQLDGEKELHEAYRHMVLDYMIKHETKKIITTHKIHGMLKYANSPYTDEKKGIIEREKPLERLLVQSEEDSSLVHYTVDSDDSHYHVLRSPDHEINNVDFKTYYDGFTTNMLMDLVLVHVPPTLSTENRSM